MTTTNAPAKFYVSNGPSADRIIDALKYAFVPGCRMTATFLGITDRRPSEQRLIAVITGVRYESGDEGSFLIEGNNLTEGGKLKGFYNAKTRKGTLELVP